MTKSPDSDIKDWERIRKEILKNMALFSEHAMASLHDLATKRRQG